ncbi:MAG: response regulator [Chloroflexota bacterium]|nr:MAG: response regulator [Chloroflexota bacterium]
MEWQWSVWVVLELAATIGMLALAFYSRNTIPPRVRNLGLLLFTLGTLYMFLHAMEIGTASPEHKYLYFKSQIVILALTATIWLAFILQYVHENYRFTPRTICLLGIFPLVVTLLVATNDLHHLFWSGDFLPSDNPFLLIYGAKPAFWFLAACIGVVFLYGIFILARHLGLMTEPIRGDAYSILVAAIIIIIFAAFTITNVEKNTPYPISSLGWGFMIAFIVILIGFRFLRTRYIRPLAQQAAIDSLTEALIAVDNQARVVYMNPAGEKFIGCTLANAYQRPVQELLPSWPQEILNIVHQPSPSVKEIKIEHNGEYVWYEIGLSPVNDSIGNLIGQVMLIQDITDRIKAEEEKHETEAKAQLASRLSTVGQMAAGICHEINNPLTTVIGYSDLLTNKDLPADAKQQVGYIHEAGRRVADIVRQLLVFARNAQPMRTTVDINDVVSRTLRLRGYQLKLANINILTELAPDLPYIIADAGQLLQVFLNIVLNAETEMKLAHGQGTLLIKTECIDDVVRISFKDDGPGIPKKDLNRIFDPFFTTRKIGEGTGLGLSVCHGIITEHRGHIYAHSELGKGATLIVELPIIEHDQAETPSTAYQEIQQVRTRPGRILVIDDDQLLLKFLVQSLTTRGHEVDGADNANDALRVFKSKRHDLILMDILRPNICGIELYKKFKRLDKSVDSRVLIMTGDILSKPTRTFLSRTKLPYIEKPFDTDALTVKIDEMLSQK